MTINSIIKGLMRYRRISQDEMAKMCGLTSFRGVQRRLYGKGMTFASAIEMLDLMGYEIVIRETQTGRRRDDEIIVTLTDDEEDD